MKQQSTSRQAVDTLRNHFLGKLISGVGYWGEHDVLLGWKDDFLGDQLKDEYSQTIAGVGSSIALQNWIGGGVRLRGGPGAARYALLELGDGAGNYEPCQSSPGWLQISYFKLGNNTNIYAGLYAYNSGGTEIVFTGVRTDVVANNWIIRANDGVAFAHTDTGVATDTNYHWHVQEVYPTSTGHQIDYYLDSELIGEQTTRIPVGIQLAPACLSYTVGGAANKNLWLNFWAMIPRGY